MFIHQSTIDMSHQVAPLARILRALREVIAGVAAIVGLLWSAPAAAVPGLTGVSSSTATNSAPSKIITVSCPAGKKVYQPAAKVDIATGAGTGNVILHQVYPTPSLDSVTAMAVQTPGFSGTWSLRVQAICGNPVANMVRVKKNGPLVVGDSKETLAVCPSNTVAYGSGFALQGDAIAGVVYADKAQLYLATPTHGLGAVVAAHVASPGFALPWGIDALTICGAPAPGMEVVHLNSPQGGATPKTLSMVCPPGKRVHGHGWDFNGSTDNAVVEDWYFSSAALSSFVLTAALTSSPGWLTMHGAMTCAF